MRISAILFALPAALLRKTRKTKRNSVCDQYSEDKSAAGEDKVLIAGCLDLKNDCRVFVVPKPDDKVADNYDEDHQVYCRPIIDLDEKSELLAILDEVWKGKENKNRSRKLRKQ